MASRAELDDIASGRVHTVQQQVRDAVELGHDVFYMHVPFIPAVSAALELGKLASTRMKHYISKNQTSSATQGTSQ